jgi:short-subunit dehydrogenase
MYKYKDKTALITGASAGIGAAFVRILASKGMNVVLVARSKEKLEKVAADIKGVKATVIPLDLTEANAISKLQSRLSEENISVDLLVNNAGFGTFGQFETIDSGREKEMIQLNVSAVVELTHAFIPAMLERKEGAIINVASTAAHLPVPYMAVYAATKAFVLSFSEALWAEYKDRGIRILSLNPGSTESEFHQVAGMTVSSFPMETAEAVVLNGLKALEEGRSFVISGMSNAILGDVLTRIIPRGQAALLAKQFMQGRVKKGI